MSSEEKEQGGPDLKPVIRLLGWLTVCYAVCFVGYLGSSDLWFWYIALRRPAWAPPFWMVTPVWMVVYGIAAAASWQIWIAPPRRDRTVGLVLFAIQLALAGLWPWGLYHFHSFRLSMAISTNLWPVAFVATVVFGRVRPSAAYLMIPWLLWTALLAVLEFVLWRMNS